MRDRPRPSSPARADIFAGLVGFASLSFQTWIVRRLLAVFGGNELTIALALTVWLLGSGVGALVGSRSKRMEWFVGFGFPLLSVLPLLFLLSSFLLPEIFGLLPGQAAGPLEMLAGSFLLIAFPAVACGIGFSRAVALQPDPKAGAGRAYLFEAIGALAAGTVFTAVWAFPLPPERALLLLPLAPVLIPFFDAGIPPRRLRIPLIGFALFMVLTIHFAVGGSTYRRFYPGRGEVLAAHDTRSGFLDVVRDGGQTTIFLDGSPAATFPDPERDQPLAHIPLSLMPEPKRALVIGGAYSSLAPEMLRHPLQRLDFIQPDPGWLSLERRYGLDPATLPRLNVFSAEPRAWLRARRREYDIILINMPLPTSAAGERFFTREFFQAVAGALAPGGIAAWGCGPVPPNLVFGRGGAALAHGMLHGQYAFINGGSLPLDFILAWGGAPLLTNDPEKISAALVERGVSSTYLDPVKLAADLDRARVYKIYDRIRESRADWSTDLRPRIYLHGLVNYAERVTSRYSAWMMALTLFENFDPPDLWPLLLLPALALAVRRWSRPGRRTAATVVLASGLASIVAEIALLVAYQMQSGALYFALAGMTAAFMAGLGMGAMVAGMGRSGRLAAALPLACALSAAGAAAAAWFGLSPSSSFTIFFLLQALLGLGTGAVFVAAATMASGDDPAGAAGWIYGFELFGSAGGGLAAGIFLVPCFGIIGAVGAAGAAAAAAAVLAWPSGGKV